MYLDLVSEEDFTRAHASVLDVLQIANDSGRVTSSYSLGANTSEPNYSTPEMNLNRLAWDIVSSLARSSGPGLQVQGDITDLGEVSIANGGQFRVA